MKIDVRHIAKLANLGLSSEEEKKFEKQLSKILEYVDKLNQVDTSDVESLSSVNGLENVTREDEGTQISLTQEEALANATEVQNGLFKVKAILEGDSGQGTDGT